MSNVGIWFLRLAGGMYFGTVLIGCCSSLDTSGGGAGEVGFVLGKL